LLSNLEYARLKLSKNTEATKKSRLGQYLTPNGIAQFMAEQFQPSIFKHYRLLDPGAGIGSLSCAFLERKTLNNDHFESIEVEAYELDDSLHDNLSKSLSQYSKIPNYSFRITETDFIDSAVNDLLKGAGAYTHAILNPPYKKINSNSDYRLLLRKVGIETVNLYSAFLALTIKLMAPHGQIVAIIPRSFCNGPYYKPFRSLLLDRVAIKHIHLFESRKKAFKDDDVLQENIIIHLERAGQQGDVIISTSSDDTFDDLSSSSYSFHKIVIPDDQEKYIHIPTSNKVDSVGSSPRINHTLDDLGIMVSTGPVVDFRVKDQLISFPEPGTVPLLYPGHFSFQHTEWPKLGFKKPNSISQNSETEPFLFPTGYYCIVRRFSSKEEKRRVVASVVEPLAFQQYKMLGFENHLNVFHTKKHGLPENIARGLSIFLNSTIVDEHFRRFSGHTQINATDLKRMKYPTKEDLIRLGEWAKEHDFTLTQSGIDEQVEGLL